MEIKIRDHFQKPKFERGDHVVYMWKSTWGRMPPNPVVLKVIRLRRSKQGIWLFKATNSRTGLKEWHAEEHYEKAENLAARSLVH